MSRKSKKRRFCPVCGAPIGKNMGACKLHKKMYQNRRQIYFEAQQEEAHVRR